MLNEVAHNKIDDIWPWVLEGLEKLRAKVPSDWHPADIYNALRQQKAFLFTIGEDFGFTVLQLLTDVSGVHLFVWVIYGPRELAEVEQQLYQALRDKAIALNARSIRMKSPRKGWQRRGWRIKEYVYEIDPWKTL